MRRYILTGAPGGGKTSIIRELEALGHAVVEEAATDVIALQQAQGLAEPHTRPSFIDEIVKLQRERQMLAPDAPDGFQVFDRSPVCTCALARHLGYPVSEALAEELARIEREGIYQRQVFFIDNLGFVEPTAARRISFEESLKFEAVHEEVYRAFGYHLVRVPVDDPRRRAGLILRCIAGFDAG
jgi:predicted ATPase